MRQLACVSSSVRVSDPVVTPPWGFESDNEFINVGMSFDTDLPPEELLDATRRIEQSISTASHRDTNGAYIDRLIDIDIIACAATDTAGVPLRLIKITTEKLTLPHPRAHLRAFVTIPLRQIDYPLYILLYRGHNTVTY